MGFILNNMKYTAEIQTSFKIKNRSIKIGILFFSRLVFSYYPEGGKAWQQALFISLQLIILLFALQLDFISLIFYSAFKLLKSLLNLFWQLFTQLFKSVSESLFSNLFKWLIILIVIMFLYTIFSDGSWTKYTDKFSFYLHQLW